MKFYAVIGLVTKLVSTVVGNKAVACKDITFGKLIQKSVASMALIAILLSTLSFGQSRTVSASTFPINPTVEMPLVLTAPPEPFVSETTSMASLSSRFNSSLAILGIWNDISSWFSASNNNQAADNKDPELNPVVPAPPANSDLSRARLLPKNQTGGTSLYSRNFGWGTGLAGLSGRGLDAGFGISYNSLNWIRVGNEMIFNPDNDNVSPGFRFGFPVIESQYLDPLTNKNTFLMVTPSGSRVEFRQVSTDTFETADSSYIQLKVLDANNLQITGTDGTNAFYQLKAGAFRCAQIKDSNGNFITVNHDNNGLLQSVTDTLGRLLNVSYDAQGSPISVTQTRTTGAFTFASLSYANLTISTNFNGLNLVGITNGATIKVLNKITYADGSHTDFDYNSYGQVWKVSNYAADNHKLNHVATNLDNVNGAQTDVPRFSEMRNWTENFNLNNGGNAQEVTIPILYQENAGFTIPGGSSVTGTLLQVTAPDGTISKTFVGNSGWMEAVPVVTEDWANNVKQRWSYTAYTQDDNNLPYLLNPRTTEARIGDSSNVRRTTMDYWMQSGNANASLFGLVKEVKVYDADQSTVLKRTTTDYNLDTNYLTRRIIGLPQKTELYDQANNLTAKVTYSFDEGNFSEAGQNITPIQQDATNYGAGFIAGRGNATSSTRWDVTDPNNAAKAITSRVKYNTAGNPVSSLDPLNREIKTSYADSFDDNVNRNTFAYPTQLTDPAGQSSTVKYRFDIGANVYAQSPAPAGQTVGKQTSRIYDALGRLEKEVVVNTGAYTRYEYPTSGVQTKVYTTITDTNNNGADAADEVLSESFSDGAGRTRMARSEHPGSAGGYSGTITEYDIMGRVKRSTVPTEVNANWQPSGDDATRGFLWSSQEYDWKGRTVRQINTDGTDKLISYEGCGCAGGQVTTVQGELVPRDDIPTQAARRTQKVYEDILGRSYKSETLNWNGTVYSTSKTFFNGRDQVTLSRQFAGADSSSTFQDTVMTYDGYGRLKTQHLPQQNSGTATTYNYFNDDRIQQVVDARGATVNYQYDNRGLTTQVSTTSPNPSVIPVTPTVTFSYDNLGNRTSMTDGLGTQTYEYNQLSQLTSETRSFADSLPNAPLANSSFRLEYGYTISGQLKSYKDPFGQQINYTFDKTGRLTAVTGSTAWSGIANYAFNPNYTARGNLKHLSYGNGTEMNINNFNNKLQATDFEIKKGATSIIKKNYQYYNDGSLKYSQDIRPNPNQFTQLNGRYDRLYIYDVMGRTVEAKSGAQARGQTAEAKEIPYNQNIQYNSFGNITGTQTQNYAGSLQTTSDSYTNNRNPNWQYDADGNTISDDEATYLTDVSGKVLATTPKDANNPSTLLPPTVIWSDGIGNSVKKHEHYIGNNTANATAFLRYYIRSSVFGGEVVTEVTNTGEKSRTHVRANGTTIASQIWGWNGNQKVELVRFPHQDPSGASLRTTREDGQEALGEEFADTPYTAEYNPFGQNAGLENPYVQELPEPDENGNLIPLGGGGGSMGGQRVVYAQDGMPVSQEYFMQMMDHVAGNKFTILENTAKMSVPKFLGFGINIEGGIVSSNAQDKGRFEDLARRSGETLHRFYLVNDDWSLNLSTLPMEQKQKENVDPPDYDKDSPEEQQRKTDKLANLFQKKVSVIGFSKQQKLDISYRLLFMFLYKPCVDAFRNAGLPTPAEMARDKGLVLVTYDALDSPLREDLMAAGITEDARIGLRNGAKVYIVDGDAYTTDPYDPQLDKFPVVTVFFGNNFQNGGGHFPFKEVFIHERIHGSGVKPNSTWWQRVLGGHDLSNYSEYNKIVEACSPPTGDK